jgi:hypothetical protein
MSDRHEENRRMGERERILKHTKLWSRCRVPFTAASAAEVETAMHVTWAALVPLR